MIEKEMSRLRFASLDMTTHYGNYWGIAVGGFAANRNTPFLTRLPVMSTKGACARMETSPPINRVFVRLES